MSATITALGSGDAFSAAGRGHTCWLLEDELGLEAGDRPCVGDTFGARPRYPLSQVVVASPKRPTLFVAPACLRMAALERELFHWGHRLQAIPRALKSLGWTPDVLIADTPPSLGAYTEGVLSCFDLIAAPVPAGAFALQGLGELEGAWREVREDGGQLVVVMNMWDRRTTATNSAVEDALKETRTPILKARIPRAEALNQAGLAYEVVYDTTPGASVSDDLKALATELAQRAGLPAAR